MAISDAVVGNLTALYLGVIVALKAYGLITGRSFGGAFVLIVSTFVVGLILVATLTWDVSRKVTYALTAAAGSSSSRDHHHGGGHEMCRGGICWHGVAVKSPASQVRFRLPQQHHNVL